jgi:tetratricopeptide (TPR) repeat protein
MLTTPSQFSYKAFISYSHRDACTAKRLHKDLERFVVPKELVGKETSRGVIKRRLGLFFIDRQDLPANSSLPEALKAKLLQCENLIVICSPAAASSFYVDEEIKEFKKAGRANSIFALIAGGRVNAGTENCLPPSLQHESEPGAPDLTREGYHLAKIKLIAGLLGVDPNELQRREIVAERRRRNTWRAAAAAAFMLAVGALVGWFSAYVEYHHNLFVLGNIVDRSARLTAKTVEAASDRGLQMQASLDFLGEATEMYSEAEGYLGKTQPYIENKLRVLLAFSDAFGRVGQVGKQRQYAQDALTTADLLAARLKYDVGGHYQRARAHLALGNVFMNEGNTAAAIGEFDAGLLAYSLIYGERGPGGSEWDRHIILVFLNLAKANALQKRGDKPEALALVETTIANLQAMVRDNAAGKVSEALISAFDKASDLLKEMGRLDDAQSMATDGLNLLAHLRTSDASNLRHRKMEMLLLRASGEIAQRRYKFASARALYFDSFERGRILYDLDPSNVTVIRDLVLTQIKIAEIDRIDFKAMGEPGLRASIARYLRAGDLLSELERKDSANRSLLILRYFINQGLSEAYRVLYELNSDNEAIWFDAIQSAGLRRGVAGDMVSGDPENKQFQVYFYDSTMAMIDLLGKKGEFREALKRTQEGLARLKTKEPSLLREPDMRRMRAGLLEREGYFLQLNGADKDAARSPLLEALDERKRLSEEQPGDTQRIRNLAHASRILAETLERCGDLAAALTAAESAIAHLDRALGLARDRNPDWEGQRGEVAGLIARLRLKTSEPSAKTLEKPGRLAGN